MPSFRPELRILKYNVNRCRLTTNQLLRDPSLANYDIVALQEPYYNNFNGGTHNPPHAKESFSLVHTATKAERPRTAMFINKRIAQTSWYVANDSRDVQSVAINIQPTRKLFIHNLYNEPDNRLCPGLQVLHQVLQQLKENHPNGEHLIVGDFNLHSPRWERNTSIAWRKKSSHEQLIVLYDIIEDFLLGLLLPIGTVTRDNLLHMLSTLNLVFGTPGIEFPTIKCSTHPVEGLGLNKGSDHFPVGTVLDIR